VGVVESTMLKPNGKRDMAIIYNIDRFTESQYTFLHKQYKVDETDITKQGCNDIGITKYFCGKSFEIVEQIVGLKEGIVVLVDTGEFGIVKRSIPEWAIEKIVNIENNPEYYI